MYLLVFFFCIIIKAVTYGTCPAAEKARDPELHSVQKLGSWLVHITRVTP
jgi:hypothetical protein